MPSAIALAHELTFEEACEIVSREARKVRAVTGDRVELERALGRVLAEAIVADRNFPPFSRAARDGYAVRVADVVETPASLKLVGEIRAGGPPLDIEVSPGTCAEIMTGAPMPRGADAIVMVEYTSRSGDEVEIRRAVQAGENFVPAGAEARSGDVMVRAGTRLNPAAIAAAAACGYRDLQVFAKPRVAILSTGDEVVDVAAEPAANQIRNSNSYALAAQVQRAGGEPVILPIAPDEPQRLRKLIEEGLDADLLLLSGGVSMGKYDLVETVFTEMGATFFFTGAKIQPGKPIVFGGAAPRKGAQPTYFFGLPGNPLSTMVCFELFARALIDALAGARPRPLTFAQAHLKREMKTKPGLTRFLPAVLSGGHRQPEVERVEWQGSGDIAAQARANCLLVVPPDRTELKAGELISVLLLE